MNYVTVPSVAREKARRAKEDELQRKTLQANGRIIELTRIWASEVKVWDQSIGAYRIERRYTPSQKTMEGLFDNWPKDVE